MKLFLLFLLASFIFGITADQMTVAQRRWLISGLVLFVTMTYFFFDQNI
ncbi:MAG: hypothetical protein KF832_20025 [Caldilineaceae bacterium]|nr:hypothetical protein [Caldilineaceae bacterium]